MRIMIKGGVWKNTEDEILKAAVMKYGKNQWARISSLLVRKSAKQCKARWYEWLDPSIKKTEWTREEDEKLLHLAKLMPTQWRTIAPIVGRTPSQCLERYEKLLDAACAKDENYEPNDDPRKLRPGEIDPNPESKPARPDPVDMDEDEKEMLSEARARLANTRGKKAKRKAREKQLEEARRLASLQKRRELKAAGINTRQRRRKRKGIDYNAEIPFEKRPPPGFFDVSGEERPVEQPKFPTTIEELEGKRRVDIEAQLRKQDIARNKIQQRQDAPSAILQANKLNDPEAVRKRSKLMLPAPQISDHELEEIVKMGSATDLLSSVEELAEGSGATRALLANYSQTPRHGMTPMRTPQRTPGGKADAVMMEAENLARLRESQTPLLGGENPELHPSDFSGVTPRKREIQTPNPMATPLASPGPMGLTPRIGMTPSRDGYSFGATPKATPFRDELHINEDIEMQESAKLELQRQAELRRNLRSGLTNLPQPKNEYQIVIQPIPEENEEVEDKIEEDMSDKIAREKAIEQARQEALLRKRSKVLQRELPRPPSASLELIRSALTRNNEDRSSFVPPTLFEQAEELINKELLALLEHDNAKYPLEEKTEKAKKKGGKRVANGKSIITIPEIDDFEEDELNEASSLIKEEVQFLRVAMGHENESHDDFVRAHDACQEDLMYFPGRNSYGLASVAANNEKLAALQNDFEATKKRMEDEAKKATRLEEKIKLLTHGHQTRAGKLWSQTDATFKQMDTAATELECFRALQKQEVVAASHRISSVVEEVNKQKELERSLQRRYGDLIAEHDRVHKLLEGHREHLRIQEAIAAKQRALEEEIAAKQRALEEEIAAKQRALEEEIAAKERALEEEEHLRKQEEIAANERSLGEEITAKNQALGEAMVAKARAIEEAVPENQSVDEEMADLSQHQDGPGIDSSVSNPTEAIISSEAASSLESQLDVETPSVEHYDAPAQVTVVDDNVASESLNDSSKLETDMAVDSDSKDGAGVSGMKTDTDTLVSSDIVADTITQIAADHANNKVVENDDVASDSLNDSSKPETDMAVDSDSKDGAGISGMKPESDTLVSSDLVADTITQIAADHANNEVVVDDDVASESLNDSSKPETDMAVDSDRKDGAGISGMKPDSETLVSSDFVADTTTQIAADHANNEVAVDDDVASESLNDSSKPETAMAVDSDSKDVAGISGMKPDSETLLSSDFVADTTTQIATDHANNEVVVDSSIDENNVISDAAAPSVDCTVVVREQILGDLTVNTGGNVSDLGAEETAKPEFTVDTEMADGNQAG